MTDHDDLIKQIEAALARLKQGEETALGELRSLLAEGSLDIKVGDISEASAIAIGRDIRLIVNQTNLSKENLLWLDRVLQQPAIRTAIEAEMRGGHIFLSYSRKDGEQAERIRAALEDSGYRVWQDITALKGGNPWVKSIERGVDECIAMVSVVSESANESEWVQIEYLHAKRREKQIIPIKIDGSEVPTMMLATHVIHADVELSGGISELLALLPPPPEKHTTRTPKTQRDLEIDYLDKLLLEHSVWQRVYTPMAGVARIRQRSQNNGKPKVVTTPTPIEAKFRKRLKEAKLSPQVEMPVEEKDFDDILPAVDAMNQLVILGDPGSGKTTTLWRIAAEYADKAKTDPAAPLPVFVRFGDMGQYPSLDAALRSALGDLAPHMDDLLDSGRLALLLDGLNELPQAGRAEHVSAAKKLVQQAQEAGTVAVVTCRELDYTGPFDMDIEDRITVEPLDPVRIHRFIEGYISEPEEAADRLFWALAGDEALAYWQRFEDKVGEPFHVFWLANVLPDKKYWGYSWRDNS